MSMIIIYKTKLLIFCTFFEIVRLNKTKNNNNEIHMVLVMLKFEIAIENCLQKMFNACSRGFKI